MCASVGVAQGRSVSVLLCIPTSDSTIVVRVLSWASIPLVSGNSGGVVRCGTMEELIQSVNMLAKLIVSSDFSDLETGCVFGLVYWQS